MNRNLRLRIGTGGIALVIGAQLGCHLTGTAVNSVGGNTPTSIMGASVGAGAEGPTADLSKPFHISHDDSQSWLAPLNFARFLARSSGGVWIVFTQKPLDDVKWTEQNGRFGYNVSPNMTVLEALTTLRKAGTSVSWEQGKSALLFDFGPLSELDEIRKEPPAETVGLLIRAATVADMVRAVSDTWRLQIDVDPELVRQRATFAATRQKLDAEEEKEEKPTSPMVAMMNARRFGFNAQTQQPGKDTVGLEFKVVKRLDQNGLLQELARYLGGTARNIGGNRWEFSCLSDPRQIAAEISRLKGVIDQATANIMAASTSYETRMGGDVDAAAAVDNPDASTQMPALSEDAAAAFDSLSILGKPATATLITYLDAEKPPLAMAAARILDTMATPEAKRALIDFTRKLTTLPNDKAAKGMLPSLQADLIRRISREPDALSTQVLTGMALDADLSQQTRSAARMALVKAGDLTAFESPARRDMFPGEMDFVLRDPPAGSGLQPMRTDMKRNAVSPLATAKSPDGDDWAVFVSGRLGDPNDIWLARGRDGKWSEFLFTGQVFKQSQDYGQGASPKPGACVLAVKGDRVVIRPPGKDNTAELARLQAAMGNVKLSMPERNKLMTRYSLLSQAAANLLAKPVTLSLSELRKDSDNDGLPDIVEERLGLDPHRADTDGDGFPDGQDENPLAAPDRSGSERVKLLQAIFTALYGKDTAPDPIIVVLEHDRWQEFYGATGRVLCMTREDYLRRSKHIGALRALQFGGPRDADSTILQRDGPCLFNESHTRAEVHFWQWRLSAQQGFYMMNNMASGGPQVTDYIAQFARKGSHVNDWKLVSIRPGQFETSDQALATLMQARMTGGDE